MLNSHTACGKVGTHIPFGVRCVATAPSTAIRHRGRGTHLWISVFLGTSLWSEGVRTSVCDELKEICVCKGVFGVSDRYLTGGALVYASENPVWDSDWVSIGCQCAWSVDNGTSVKFQFIFCFFWFCKRQCLWYPLILFEIHSIANWNMNSLQFTKYSLCVI